MPRRHPAIALLLTCLLVFAQQAAVLHALAHVTAETTQQRDQHPPGASVCDKCIAFAEIEGAAPLPQFIVRRASAALPHFGGDLYHVAIAALRHYLSRAPPCLA